MRHLLNKIKQWWNPKFIYVVIGSDNGWLASEIVVCSSHEEARIIFDIVREQYGGANAVLASRRIDDIPYLIQRRRLVNTVARTNSNDVLKEGM